MSRGRPYFSTGGMRGMMDSAKPKASALPVLLAATDAASSRSGPRHSSAGRRGGRWEEKSLACRVLEAKNVSSAHARIMHTLNVLSESFSSQDQSGQ